MRGLSLGIGHHKNGMRTFQPIRAIIVPPVETVVLSPIKAAVTVEPRASSKLISVRPLPSDPPVIPRASSIYSTSSFVSERSVVL